MPNELAKKYRPKTLKEVIGQQKVITKIEGMLMEEVPPPAILLHGPHSSGKTTLSRIIPTYVNCADKKSSEPCWECRSCIAALSMILGERPHPDVEIINCAGSRGIDMTRSLHDRATFRPTFNFRYFILDECHRLTKDAEENLLALLEDPPRRTRFILLTTNPEALKSTLKSRCQVFALGTVDTAALALLLRKVTKKEGRRLPKSACKEIAEAAQGFPREALKITEQVLNGLAVSGETKVDSESITRVVREVTEFTPTFVIKKYVEGVFEANYTLAFSAIDHVESYEYMVNKMIETIQEALYYWVDPAGKTLTRENHYLLKDISLAPTKTGRKFLANGQIQQLIEVYLKAQERIKAYLVNPRAVMQSATMEAIQITTKWNSLDSASEKK